MKSFMFIVATVLLQVNSYAQKDSLTLGFNSAGVYCLLNNGSPYVGDRDSAIKIQTVSGLPDMSTHQVKNNVSCLSIPVPDFVWGHNPQVAYLFHKESGYWVMIGEFFPEFETLDSVYAFRKKGRDLLAVKHTLLVGPVPKPTYYYGYIAINPKESWYQYVGNNLAMIKSMFRQVKK